MKIYFSFIFLFTVLSFSCNRKVVANSNTSEVSFLDNPHKGAVTIEAIGYGSKVSQAEENAVQKAFKTILVQGLPIFTALSKPLITSDKMQGAKGFMDTFFSNGDYEQFITSQDDPSIIGEYKKPKSYKVAKKMTINYEALRKHLENKGVTRTFGL